MALSSRLADPSNVASDVGNVTVMFPPASATGGLSTATVNGQEKRIKKKYMK